MIRDCRRCGYPMRHDLGPADNPDALDNVRIEQVWRCDSCGYEVAHHTHTWSDMEIVSRCEAVIAITSLPDLDERAKVLAEHGYEMRERRGH